MGLNAWAEAPGLPQGQKQGQRQKQISMDDHKKSKDKNNRRSFDFATWKCQVASLRMTFLGGFLRDDKRTSNSKGES
jgi:hypothetical protein